MATKVQGIILRSTNPARLVRFYSALGLAFTEHQHGGPVHAECKNVDESPVLEIYAASDDYPQDALILSVDSLDDMLREAVAAGGEILRPIKSQASASFAYIADPEGRPILLYKN